jgi:hypothetical protein
MVAESASKRDRDPLLPHQDGIKANHQARSPASIDRGPPCSRTGPCWKQERILSDCFRTLRRWREAVLPRCVTVAIMDSFWRVLPTV